jgi:hypothetical protein
MKRIVTTHYRYKRPPRKAEGGRAQCAGDRHQGGTKRLPAGKADATQTEDRKSAIVKAKNPHRRHGRFRDVPDMTPEEHRRRGDAADALFREMKRQIAASKRS